MKQHTCEREIEKERLREETLRVHNMTRKYRVSVNLDLPYSEAGVPRALHIIKHLHTFCTFFGQ